MRTNVIALSVALAALYGCGGGQPTHQPSEKYYMVCANPKIPYWQEAGAGLIAAARQLGVQAEVAGPDIYDATAEKNEFHRAAAKNPSGILVSPGNSDILTPEIDAAIRAGIPVITVDSDAPQSQRLFFIGTNNYQAGQAGGRRVAKLMNGKGTVVFLTIAGQKNLEERLDGYQSVFEGYPGIKVQSLMDMKGDSNVAFDLVKEMVEKKNLPDAFVALESLSGAEIAEVLDRAKVDNKIIMAMDASQNTVEWIEKGKIAATIMQKPYTMGYYGLKALAEVALRRPPLLAADFRADPKSVLPMLIDTGTMLIDGSNAGSLRAK